MSDHNETDQIYDSDEPMGDRDIPSVATSGNNQLLIGSLFGLLLLLAVGFVIWDASNNKPEETRLTDPDEEEFKYSRTPTSTPLLRAEDTLPADNGESERDRKANEARLAQLQAEAIRRQREQMEREQERIKSPQLAFSHGSHNDVPPVSSKRNDALGLSQTAQQLRAGSLPGSNDGQPPIDADEAFLNRAAGREIITSAGTQLRNLDSLIPQGTMIPGILETAISTDVRGQVRAITSAPVWSMDQSRILIPRGTRLIGEYNADIRHGQGRLYVIWTRLIRSDGVSINITSGGTDDLGRAGLNGQLDTHFWDRFGAAIILTIVDGAIEALADSVSEETDNTIQLGDGGSGIDRAIEQTIRQNVNIRPTIHIDQGERINVFLARDLDFSTVEF